MTEEPATTKELFDRWRAAVQALDDLEAESEEWRAARYHADLAWNDYEHRLDEERAPLNGGPA